MSDLTPFYGKKTVFCTLSETVKTNTNIIFDISSLFSSAIKFTVPYRIDFKDTVYL